MLLAARGAVPGADEGVANVGVFARDFSEAMAA